MLARRLAAIAILASILAAGCTMPDGRGFEGSDTEEGLQTVPVRPDATEVVAEQGETVVFVVRCEAPGPSRTVEVTWERAVAGEGVDERGFSRGSSEDQHSYTSSFDEVDDYVVTAKCRSDDDRARPHLWNVTVEEPGDDEGTDGNRTLALAARQGQALPDRDDRGPASGTLASAELALPGVRSPDRPTPR